MKLSAKLNKITGINTHPGLPIYPQKSDANGLALLLSKNSEIPHKTIAISSKTNQLFASFFTPFRLIKRTSDKLTKIARSERRANGLKVKSNIWARSVNMSLKLF